MLCHWLHLLLGFVKHQCCVEPPHFCLLCVSFQGTHHGFNTTSTYSRGLNQDNIPGANFHKTEQANSSTRAIPCEREPSNFLFSLTGDKLTKNHSISLRRTFLSEHTRREHSFVQSTKQKITTHSQDVCPNNHYTTTHTIHGCLHLSYF